MSPHEAFQLSDRDDDGKEDERAGLLGAAEEHDSEVSDLEELGTKNDHGSKPAESAFARWKRKWLRIIVVALLASWTLGFLVHSFLSRKDSSTQTTVAQLRPEEDYILDADWDFNSDPVTREYDWTISEHELNPDGVFRPMTLISAMFPGPLIECNEGDEIVVHVHNKASNATSIHWHGMYQNGTNWMDGTVGVTQCPIAPGRSFTYRFNVTGQTGTYWYHSHMAMQASDGLVGPIVIHARGDARKKLQEVPYTQDRVVMVSDHYYNLSSELLMQYLRPGNENEEPVPHTALINGRGTRNCSALPNRKCSSDGRSNALFDLSTEHNTRLRIINVGALAEFQIQLDEHEFFVTEVDGTDVHPQSIHRLTITPAQRYSIVVPPPQNAKDLYWLRARMITHCFAYDEPEQQEEVRAVLRYSAPASTLSTALEPHSKDWPEVIELECRDLNTSALVPVHAIAAPQTADDTLSLRSSFQIRDWRLSRGYLNDSSYRANLTHPILSTLLAAYEHNADPHASLLSRPSAINTGFPALVYQTTGLRTLDILIQNLDDGNHPFHLHGYKFWVLAAGHGYPPEDLYAPGALDVRNPLRRDTASVEAFGWTALRVVADNPGVWALHCHLGWHNEAGLAMQIVTRADEVAGWTVPEEVRALCGVEGGERGAGPEDEIWFGAWD